MNSFGIHPLSVWASVKYRAFILSLGCCFHLTAPHLQENEDSTRRSGVAFIADLVRMLEVYVPLRPALPLYHSTDRFAAHHHQMSSQAPPS